MARGNRASGSSTLVEPRVKELTQSVRRIQSLMDEAPIGICNVDLKGKITYVNKRFEEVSGYSREKVVGKNGFKLGIFSDETIKILVKRMKDRLAGKSPRLLEVQFKCKDGHWIWVSMEGKVIRERGIPVGFQIISRDITELKQAEEALQESEEKYRTLVEDALVGIMNVDITGKITYVNKTIMEATGYSWEEMVGKNAFSLGLISGEMAKVLRKRLKEKLMGQPPGLLEIQYKRKDGEWIWLQIRGKVLRKNNVPVGIQIIGDDITERKQAEEALRESREQLRKMFESVTDGISVINLKGIITETNERTVKMHGFSSKAELLGKSAFELVASRDHERIVANMREALRQGIVRGVEYTLLKADGTEFPGELSTSVLKDASGNPVGHITIARDITERKRMERALRESEEKFSKAFLSSPTDSITLTRLKDGLFMEVNENFLRTTGYTREEVINHTSTELGIWAKAKDRARMLQMLKEKGRVHNEEFTFGTKSGETREALFSAELIDIGGEPCVISMTIDISELRKAEEKLKEAQEKLIRSERLAAIGQLASGVGHELRNPLGAIKNAVLYVRRRITRSELLTHTEPKVLEFLDIIDEEVDSANKVITDLLSFSRVAKPAVSLVNVSSIIKDALNHVAAPEGVKSTIDIDPSLPMVMVDAIQIRQVFINIVLNALEAMPEGGHLEIRARSKGEFVTVEFADTGCGIPESVLAKIFEPLFTTKPKGIGLGLAMSRSIMESHGGDIGVRSKEGKGTTFILLLPMRAV